MTKAVIPIAMVLAFLTGCGEASNARGAGGVSVEDAKALDEAAAQLDNQPSQTSAEQQK